jgi:membrane protein required for colicin V production
LAWTFANDFAISLLLQSLRRKFLEASMAIYDIVVLIVLGVTILLGYHRGLMRQVASIASIIAGYLVAMSFREPLSKAIPAEAPWNKIAAMAILFLATSLLIWSIYASISKSLKKMEIKGFDHQAGAIFGGLKGLLICCIGTMFAVSLLGDRVHRSIHESKTGSFVVSTIYTLAEYLPIVPTELRAYLNPQFDRFDKAMGSSDNQLDIKNPAAEQGFQNPFTVPSYQGQWNFPTQTSGSGGGATGTSGSAGTPSGTHPNSGRNIITDMTDAAAEAAARAAAERARQLFGGNR